MFMAIYGRVSTEEQAEKGTIDSQVSFAEKYFDLHGITEYEIYLDEGVSGTIPLQDRPAAAKMLKDVMAGKIKAVHVYRLDRLARSVKHVLDTYEVLEAHNVALVSMTEQFDTGTPTGKFFMTLLASIAALERDTIVERTQAGKKRAAKDGRWTSGQPPYGYIIGPDKRLAINDAEAKVIKDIYKMYIGGMATVPVAKYLNAKGIPTPAMSKGTKNPNTGKWNAGHISRIIRNKIYIGEYITQRRSKQQKAGVRIEVPEIIDRDTFIAANERIIKNADVARGSKGRDYILRGLIYCSHCGRAYVGSSGASKEGRVYYRCSGTYDQGNGKMCNSKLVRAQDVEQTVWEDVLQFIQNPNRVFEAIEKRIKSYRKDLAPIEKELEEVEKIIKEKHLGRNSVLSLLTKGIITEVEAEQQLLNIAREMSLLQERKDVLFTQVNDSKEMSTKAVHVAATLQKINPDNLTLEGKIQIMRAFVRRIEVITANDEKGRKKATTRNYYYFSDPKTQNDMLCGSEQLMEFPIATLWIFNLQLSVLLSYNKHTTKK